MFQSLAALPVAVLLEAGLFFLLCALTPMAYATAALVVAMISLAVLFGFSVLYWPGADVLTMYVAVQLIIAYLLATLMQHRKQRREETGGKSGFQFAPLALVIFFLVLLVADSIFVYVSKDGLPDGIARWLLPGAQEKPSVQSSFPGVIHRDYQKKEALFNDYLNQLERQKSRGWQVNKGWLGTPKAKQETIFHVKILDRHAMPVSGASVSGVFQRPADSRLDYAFDMQSIGNGYYQANINLPQPGQWDLALSIQRGDLRHELSARTAIGRAN